MSKTITIDIPEIIWGQYEDPSEIEKTIFEDIIIGEYQKGNLSIREGAKILGLTYEGFIEWLGKRNLPFINASNEELQEDYEEFERFMERHKNDSNL